MTGLWNTFRDRFDMHGLVNLLPDGMRSHVQMHMDTAPKAIRHSLAAMAICNLFLFFSSLSAHSLPNMGLNVLLVTLLSCCHTVIVYLVLFGHRYPDHRIGNMFSNSEFSVGATMGTSLGMSLLNLVISIYFGRLSNCDPNFQQLMDSNSTASSTSVYPTFSFPYACTNIGAMWGVWFWGGLLFWLNLWLAILIHMGKDELATTQAQYEDIGISMEEMDQSVSHSHQGEGGFQGDFPAPGRTPGF